MGDLPYNVQLQIKTRLDTCKLMLIILERGKYYMYASIQNPGRLALLMTEGNKNKTKELPRTQSTGDLEDLEMWKCGVRLLTQMSTY